GVEARPDPGGDPELRRRWPRVGAGCRRPPGVAAASGHHRPLRSGPRDAGPSPAARVRGVRGLPRPGAGPRLLPAGRLPVLHGATAGAWPPPPSRLQALVAGLNPSTPLARPVSAPPIPIDDNARRIVVGRLAAHYDIPAEQAAAMLDDVIEHGKASQHLPQ